MPLVSPTTADGDQIGPVHILPPPIEYPSQTEYPNIVLINGQVFTLEQVACNFQNAVEAHHQYYRAQFEDYQEQQRLIMQQVISDDTSRDITRLARIRSRGTVTIPEALFNKTVKVMENMLWEVRTVLYEPEEVKTNEDYLRQYCWNRLSEAHRQECIQKAASSNRGNLTINFRCPFKACIEFYYNDSNNLIKSDDITFHTLSERRLCTGNADARSVWRNTSPGAFAQYINRINMFSMASSEITLTNLLTRESNTFNIRDVVNSETIVSIIPEETSTWRT